MDQLSLDAHARRIRFEEIPDRRGRALGDRQLATGLFGRQHGSDHVRAHRLLARAIALPFLVRRIEDDMEWSRFGRNTNVELELAAGCSFAAHALVARQLHTLSPGALGRFSSDRVLQQQDRPFTTLSEQTKAVIRCRKMETGAPASDDADDAVLVEAMARGDRDALARLYARHSSLLLGLALRIVRERREAEDLLHDVFLEAWRAAKNFDPKRGRARTWLAIRMRSRCLDHQKSARVSRNAGDAGLEGMVDEREKSTPDHGRVRKALGSLAEDQRQVVELAYFDGLSCSEIAAKIGRPVGTVKSRLAAGLSRLREGFRDDGGGK